MTDETSIDNAQAETTKGKRERSPAYPFISLKEALERAKKFAGQYKRHPARLSNAVSVWGYSPKSSGGIQTIAALKAFGLLKVQGSGDDRKVELTELAWRILEGNQKSTRKEAISESVLKPSIISECWGKWGAERPPDAEFLDHLIFDRNFNRDAAIRFLKIYDDTISYGNLTESDIYSPGEDQNNSGESGTDDRPSRHVLPDAEGDLTLKGESGTDDKPPKYGRRRRTVKKEQYLKEFIWPLSDGTTAELVIAGVRPGMDEIEILKANFDVAKKVLEKIAKHPPEGSLDDEDSQE